MATIHYWDRNPPYGALAIAAVGDVTVTINSDPKATKDTVASLALADGEVLRGTSTISRYLSRASTKDLQGKDALSSVYVDNWMDHCAQLVPSPQLESLCIALSDYLALRSFFVGYQLSSADLSIWGALQGCPLWKKIKSSGKVPHLSRWFDLVSSFPEVQKVVDENDLAKKRAVAAATDSVEAKKGGGDTGSFDIDLPGAKKGHVVTRFPPEPSGYLHIGHAKAALLNQHFAQMYEGKLLVRFDDTNPSKEKDEFVENILKDIADLGLKYDRLTYTSDYFPQLLEIGERLIKKGVMYADDTPVEQMRNERLERIESKRRNRTVEENLKIWEEMKAGSEVGLLNCMRFKIGMSSDNGCMRDPVAFRCNLTHHWRTGHTYKLYPTYDCACPFVDAYEGVTHALRTSEYKDREEQFYWVLKAMQAVWPDLPNVHIWDYSRLNFVHTVLSKRKLAWLVDNNHVDGWFDPRMPTVQGILRRGMVIPALKEFILSQGASKNVTTQEWDKIWTINKKHIDAVCPRHTAVETENKVLLTLSDGPSVREELQVPRHKKHAPAGEKTQVRLNQIWIDQADAKELKDGEEVTLMDWGNAIVEKITRSEDGQTVTALSGKLNLAGDVKKTKWKLTWLADVQELVNLTLIDFDYIISKRKIEVDDDFKEFVNDQSRTVKVAVGDINTAKLAKGEIIQLERKGYYIVDEPYVSSDKPVVLFAIPDGRQKPANK
eukprot:CAMPEP_0175064070 /NCGR_PEP_ID=MMETSP0052_2-20121109/15117_1 /TAXON_ID=51329 ORGANISM="Polytomella parva, Strain SAG 63-3" /NCGR_SAMPLE_ID=MMETSP0052_2 /ASSEMBLY_ACC=CAM_ASM_000194 /LENGTH=719 /DNA_ID=CAMNT_0016330357 /DNA_START=184 /DNA_END=2343 /DNA_ORIENTATION=+